MKYDLKNMVNDNKHVSFTYATRTALYYTTECNFTFPVPYGEIGNASFRRNEKAILLMRWIKKHITLMESYSN